MKREELNQALVTRFSELLPGYLELKRLWGGEEPGPHITYGDLLVPLIDSKATQKREHELADVMKFLEELSDSGDSDTLDVVVTSVLEPLLDSADRQRLEQTMGPRTRVLWKRLLADG